MYLCILVKKGITYAYINVLHNAVCWSIKMATTWIGTWSFWLFYPTFPVWSQVGEGWDVTRDFQMQSARYLWSDSFLGLGANAVNLWKETRFLSKCIQEQHNYSLLEHDKFTTLEKYARLDWILQLLRRRYTAWRTGKISSVWINTQTIVRDEGIGRLSYAQSPGWPHLRTNVITSNVCHDISSTCMKYISILYLCSHPHSEYKIGEYNPI